MSETEQSDKDDNPGVIARPPFLFLGVLVAAYVIDYFFAVRLLGTFLQLLGAAVLIIPGLVFMINAIRGQTDAGTNYRTQEPDTALVTTGIYQFSRNPIYLGMTFLYLGLAILGDNIYAIFLLAPLLLLIRYGVIAREEKYLESKFGDEYLQYKKDVNRWF